MFFHNDQRYKVVMIQDLGIYYYWVLSHTFNIMIYQFDG